MSYLTSIYMYQMDRYKIYTYYTHDLSLCMYGTHTYSMYVV
jgi:hypothetical protein